MSFNFFNLWYIYLTDGIMELFIASIDGAGYKNPLALFGEICKCERETDNSYSRRKGRHERRQLKFLN